MTSTRALRHFAIASCGFVVTELCFPSRPHLLTPPHTSSPLLTPPQSPASPSSSTRGIKSRALICLLPFWPYRRSQTDRVSCGDLRQTPPPPRYLPLPTGQKKHSFIRAMFKPLCDIPRTSATRRLSLIHYLIPLL